MLAAGLILGCTPARAAEPVTLRAGDLAAAPGPGAVEHRAAELLAREIERRTGVRVPVGSAERARVRVMVGTLAATDDFARYAAAHPEISALGTDGFSLDTTPDESGRVWLVGQSPSGVVAGVGRLLRLLRYAEGSVGLPAVALTDVPKLPVRGIYYATHFGNFYHVAPLEEVDEVVEDYALAGGNSLSVWFDMHHFSSFDDPAAKAHLARLKHYGQTARSVGMQFGLTFIANEGYAGTPAELREQGAPGAYGCEVCPSRPGGLELIARNHSQVLDAFGDVDFIWTWPYDQGGCWCADCQPWGARGFLRASEQLARLYHDRQPDGKVWLSTWLLDSFPGATGEYDGLLAYLRDMRPQWPAGILTGTHGDRLPAPLEQRPEPERYPVTCFPEISMYRMDPWGGYGANPLPDFCARLAGNSRGDVVGGWPYSEGIYEDLNKAFWVQWYWDPDKATDDILTDYASYYLAPEVSADAVRLFHLLEATHARSGWRVANLSKADEAWTLAQSIDERLPRWSKGSWRWRLLLTRAHIDHILHTQGYATPEAQAALQPLADEISAIYHATDTFIKPPAFVLPHGTPNLASGRPVVVSSHNPECPERELMLTDGVLAQDDGENFWAHDPSVETTPMVTVDLGAVKPVREVRLQYRGLYGQFWFIPTTITIEVSSDGVDWHYGLETDRVPVEATPYSPELWSYPVVARARYLRLTLGPSQHVMDPYPGVVELTEIEVN